MTANAQQQRPYFKGLPAFYQKLGLKQQAKTKQESIKTKNNVPSPPSVRFNYI